MTTHPSRGDRWWAVLRLALGMLQVFGATLGMALLISVGVTPVLLAVVEFVRVEYDLRTVAAAIRQSELPDVFADDLETGGVRSSPPGQ